MSREIKWLIGVLITIAIAIHGAFITIGVSAVRAITNVRADLSSLDTTTDHTREQIVELKDSFRELTQSMRDLVQGDIAQLYDRISAVEAKDILPRASKIAEDHEKRLRAIEMAIGKLNNN